MSDLLLSFFLGLVQGLTEFLPISSSAHLLLPSLIFGSNDLGLPFDIAVHAGTLVAVIYFFRTEIILMTKSIFTSDDRLIEHRKLATYLIIATIPIIFAGLIFSNIIQQRIFSISSIAISNLFFAVILLFAFLTRKSKKNLFQLTLYGALFIGIVIFRFLRNSISSLASIPPELDTDDELYDEDSEEEYEEDADENGNLKDFVVDDESESEEESA